MLALSSLSEDEVVTVAQLQSQLAEQGATIARLTDELAHTRKIFERASVRAQIGVWECDLVDSRLRWTDVVYDMFDIPRGAPLDRAATLQLYPPAIRRELEEIRSRAIADRTGFTLDAEIVTARGRSRWIRITASVECAGGVPVRIFGMKQDITAEKTASIRLRYLAEFDSLTGLANRTRFQDRILGETNGETEVAPVGAIMLVDLDRFKDVNDECGHLVGDEVLREVGRRLSFLGRHSDCVARIGGDEFALVFAEDVKPDTVRRLGRAIVRMMRRPILAAGLSVEVGASVGIAFAGRDVGDILYSQADTALYAAKDAGRGTVRVFANQAGLIRRRVFKAETCGAARETSMAFGE